MAAGCGWRRDWARAGGGTVVEGGSEWGASLWGGCPGRDFLRMGTLVVRMTRSSLLVVGEGEGGGLLVARVEECAVGGGIGGVLGGGGKAVVVVAVDGTMAVGSGLVSSRLLSVWWTSSSLTSWRSGTSGLAAGSEYGSLWSSSSTEAAIPVRGVVVDWRGEKSMWW